MRELRLKQMPVTETDRSGSGSSPARRMRISKVHHSMQIMADDGKPIFRYAHHP
jgi:hypothetical protein